jgi:hypothetical protein
MLKDKRTARRRPIRYVAWVVLGADQLHGCVLSDISDTGARIDVENSKTIPDRFPLLLSGSGSARRLCRVMWRKPKQVGVKFEQRLAAGTRATLVPQLDAGADAGKLAAATVENA